MNNGNFFPNFNNGQDASNANASLNSMNMQANGGGFTYNPEGQTQGVEAVQAPITPEPVAPMAPEVAPVMPQMEMPVAPAPGVEAVQTPATPEPVAPMTQESPQMNSEPISPIPDFGQVQAPVAPMPAADVAPIAPNPPEIVGDVAPVADIPLFNSPEFNQPVEPTPAPVMETAPETPTVEPLLTATEPVAPAAPMPEAPLFNPELATPEVSPATDTAYTVPVTTETPAVATDKFTQVKELLNNNGIEYKAYSNETGNCIVIEL